MRNTKTVLSLMLLMMITAAFFDCCRGGYMYTAEEQEAIVDAHNQMRQLAGGSNIRILSWNEMLATYASQYADECYFEHGRPAGMDVSRWGSTGQNLFLTTGKPSAVDATKAWYFHEVDNYNITTGRCQRGKMCGHYTQVTWSSTREVGCSEKQCSPLTSDTENFTRAAIVVCHYGPSGNFGGERPFRPGPSCTACPSDARRCTKGLCANCSTEDANSRCSCGMTCKNGGTLDARSCSCACAPGWTGSDCTATCKDKEGYCRRQVWPINCREPDIAATLSSVCPVMCRVCRPASPKKAPCLPNPCINGGSCTVYQGDYKCTCVEGWSGSICEAAVCRDKSQVCSRSFIKPEKHCRSVYFKKKCPKRCGLCPPCTDESICAQPWIKISVHCPIASFKKRCPNLCDACET